VIKRYKHLSQGTLDRIDSITNQNMSIDEFVNRAIDMMLGVDCNHDKLTLCMRMPTNEIGYLNIDAAINQLNDIHYGRKHNCMFRVCEKCLRVENINHR